MSLSLACVDLETTPSGFTATIAGSLGASVSVYYTPADRPWPGDAWILGGTRTGDGDVEVLCDPRHYFAYAATTTAVAQPERFAVTTGEDALATRCRVAVIAILQSLALEEIGDRVYDHQYPDGTEMEYPCIGVHLYNLSEQQEQGLNAADYISYPCRVIIYDTAIKRTDHTQSAKNDLWRQSIYRAFRDQHLPGVSEVRYVRVEPLLIANLDQSEIDGRQFDYFAGGFTIRCVAMEPRGIGA